MPKQSSQRLPAPSLFVGPPSHNASATSLTKPTSNTSSVPSASIPGPTTPHEPHQPRLSRQETRQSTATAHSQPDALDPRTGVGVNQAERKTRPRRGTAVLDAHWAALQSTLADIELSAGSEAHVFGAAHAQALEDLRAAQVELARAWGRSGDEEVVSDVASDTLSLISTGEKERKGSVGTAQGVAEAARRRDVSDRYFAGVKKGVNEVVRKLDVVSSKMRAVEMQSREIWGEGESVSDTSLDTASRVS